MPCWSMPGLGSSTSNNMDPKPRRKRQSKALAIRKEKPVKVIEAEIYEDPVDIAHKAVQLVGDAVKAVSAVVDFAAPHIEKFFGSEEKKK
jgi:hypothetical protein